MLVHRAALALKKHEVAIPEAFFDTIVINGGVYPKVSVPPKRVRFRLLNGSQARFYHLNLYPEDRSNPGEARVGTPGPVIYQVGTEGGFLTKVAIHANGKPISTCYSRLPSEPMSSSTSTACLREAASSCTTMRRDRSRAAMAGMTISPAAPTKHSWAGPRRRCLVAEPTLAR
jgi:FtsP/CotA-like multicopper oxidase with cupredoxin domain